MTVKLTINSIEHSLDLQGHETLLEVLRDQLGLTGTKTGCQEAECGACTILVDGKPKLACILLAGLCEGREITTIEGLAFDGKLHPLQQAFLDEGAVQCGFCIPGVIMASAGLLKAHPDPTPAAIVRGLDGNICRCGGYHKISAAITRAAQEMAKHHAI